MTIGWQGHEEWTVCARCGTSRPAKAVEPFGDKLVCGDAKWCSEQAARLGLLDEAPPGLPPEPVSVPEPSAPDLGGEE